ncbi:hypothetical protein J2751_001774 [Halorubrum alkaliphilum]|uniref:Uncharacterized protein n=1 Tax=Halorubrum alkaliphilum TaxID=261290 RepID=A0A8T4GGJ0_9EURY|nr:hypothetical protein [Halorubrum alkaliphilum]MBP1922760.1 hypothetical protein [Halorubrum alkaliphilum]
MSAWATLGGRRSAGPRFVSDQFVSDRRDAGSRTDVVGPEPPRCRSGNPDDIDPSVGIVKF